MVAAGVVCVGGERQWMGAAGDASRWLAARLVARVAAAAAMVSGRRGEN